MYKLSMLDKISFLLVIIGAINWGLIGLFNLNVVALIFGEPAPVAGRIVYILIGIAGVNMIVTYLKMRKCLSCDK